MYHKGPNIKGLIPKMAILEVVKLLKGRALWWMLRACVFSGTRWHRSLLSLPHTCCPPSIPLFLSYLSGLFENKPRSSHAPIVLGLSCFPLAPPPPRFAAQSRGHMITCKNTTATTADCLCCKLTISCMSLWTQKVWHNGLQLHPHYSKRQGSLFLQFWCIECIVHISSPINGHLSWFYIPSLSVTLQWTWLVSHTALFYLCN